MEESEKRKERLNAMRMEASQTVDYPDFESPRPASSVLSNPLIESENANASPHQYTSPRFDFYTDPMSAFSGSKRRNNISPQVSQGHYNTPPRPTDQAVTPNPAYHHYPAAQNSSGQGLFHAPRPYFSQSPMNSPMGPTNRPHQNPPSPFNYGTPPNSNPMFAVSPSSGPHQNSPRSYNYGTPPNLSRASSNFTSPGFTQGGSPYGNYGQGRGHQGQNSNFHYDSGHARGRGRSFGNNTSPGSGSGFRRGVGSRDSVSAELRPGSYYSKEMVQDPWSALNPVMWKGVGGLGSSDKSWLPKSIAMKKLKVSPEACQPLISQQSLAEYLAASFNDSIDEAVDD